MNPDHPTLEGAAIRVRANRRKSKKGRRRPPQPATVEAKEAGLLKEKARSRARRAIEKKTRKAQRKGRR